MWHASLFGFLLLLYFVKTENVFNGSSSETPQETTPPKKLVDFLATKMTVSPTWYLNVGDTVEINCTTIADKGNNSDKMNLQLLWTKMGPGNKTKTVLVSQRASTRINYILGPVTHEHQGIYTCDDDGSLPDVYVIEWHYIIWVADASPSAVIDVVSHNRSQFLSLEEFTLGCQLPDTNTHWKMMRFDKWWGTIKECPNQESSNGRLSCTSRSEYPWADILYWCESSAGERTNALNITSTVGVSVTLESPPLPVLEGEDVTLRCLLRDKNTQEITSNSRAVFYKNKRRIWIETQGSLTLKAVTKADEGMYMCRHPDEGPSDLSWVSVKAQPDKDKKKKKSGI